MKMEQWGQPGCIPDLEPGYRPAVLWNRAYRARVAAAPERVTVGLALVRPDGTCFRREEEVLPHRGEDAALNVRYLERLLKFLLWQQGGSRVLIGGCPPLAEALGRIYSPGGDRGFDVDLVGGKFFREPMSVQSVGLDELPAEQAPSLPLGRHLDGCRIGFDLGGSDRKCAALVDGKVVFSEEIAWDPYFQTDPGYHLAGIRDTLARAAAHLPRVDAIGGSAAGGYVNSEVRVASLFRGIGEADFETHVRPLFHRLREEWNNIPFVVVNDGEVTALAGSMALNDNAVLGISMGTSLAAGYCDGEGHITSWINELAFAPVDYQAGAARDEWSGDMGCGVQYFSQQGVARWAEAAGFAFAPDTPLPERLVLVQQAMEQDDPRARSVYETLGTCFGYAIAHYDEFYEIRNLLILGRVTSGPGGDRILRRAKEVLRTEFPERADRIRLTTPDEKQKRHGQAIAAASLPALREESP